VGVFIYTGKIMSVSNISDTTLFTVQEVAQLLKLSVLTIYKYIKEQKIEAVEFGGHYRIEKISLERFINTHRVKKNNNTEE
jgi:excisionase family DNA binding protein